MFAAIGRWIKAVGYLLTGQIDAARRTLDTNPHVVRAKYDEIIKDKTDRIHQYKQAVAALIAQQEKKVGKVKTLTEETEKLERMKAGALAKAKQVAAALQKAGKSKEEIHADEEYMKCSAAFSDFSSTLAEKLERITELEGDITEYTGRVNEHKVQLQGLLRDLETIKSEQHDAVADMITAQQEKEIADTISGIAQDGTAEELQKMRELRQEVKAEAKISKELAGTDAKAQEREFLEYARTCTGNDEFDSLIGLADEVESTPATPDLDAASQDTALPE